MAKTPANPISERSICIKCFGIDFDHLRNQVVVRSGAGRNPNQYMQSRQIHLQKPSNCDLCLFFLNNTVTIPHNAPATTDGQYHICIFRGNAIEQLAREHYFCIVLISPSPETTALWSEWQRNGIMPWNKQQKKALRASRKIICLREFMEDTFMPTYSRKALLNLCRIIWRMEYPLGSWLPVTTTESAEYPRSFKLIDCDEGAIVRLQDIKVSSGSRIRYTTLSYRWGKIPKKDRELLEITYAPILIKDAMRLSKELEFRYLWVDRYCVPRQRHPDRTTQLSSMHLIYAQSDLTIIAAVGAGPDTPLPGMRDWGSLVGWQQANAKGGRIRQLAPRPDDGNHWDSFKKEFTQSLWNTRAWTYQEGLFAARRLVFTQSYVYYQGPGSSGSSLHVHVGVNRERLFQWTGKIADHAAEYMTRSLSVPSDVYPAFAGVEAALRGSFWPGSSVLYGLPLDLSPNQDHLKQHELFLYALLWIVPGMTGSWIERRHDCVSWTWLGWHMKSRREGGGPAWPWKEDPVDWMARVAFYNNDDRSRPQRLHDVLVRLGIYEGTCTRVDDRIPYLLAQGQLFSFAQLLSHRHESDLAAPPTSVVNEPEPHMVDYVTEPSLGSAVEGWMQAAGCAEEDRHHLRNVVCLVLGRLHPEEKTSTTFLIMVLVKEGHTYQRLNIIPIQLTKPLAYYEERRVLTKKMLIIT